jgi:hypothetical protein
MQALPPQYVIHCLLRRAEHDCAVGATCGSHLKIRSKIGQVTLLPLKVLEHGSNSFDFTSHLLRLQASKLLFFLVDDVVVDVVVLEELLVLQLDIPLPRVHHSGVLLECTWFGSRFFLHHLETASASLIFILSEE